jgi:hypothetical protein
MYLGRILKYQQPQLALMCYSRELTYCNEDWSTQPSRLYSINNFNVSKTSNIFPKSIVDGES